MFIKYFQLFFLTTLLLDHLFCIDPSQESTEKDNDVDNVEFYREIGCTVACIETNLTAVISNCHKDCKMLRNNSIEMTQVESNETFRLICREYNSFTIHVKNDYRTQRNDSYTSQRHFNGALYLINLQENSSKLSKKLVYIADTPIMRVGNLKENTSYIITAAIFTKNFEYRQLPDIKIFKTLENDQYTPMTISNETFSIEYKFKNDSNKIIATIHWNPAEDMICNYLLRFYGVEDVSFNTHIFRKLTRPDQLYSFETNSLDYDSRYVIDVTGINSKNYYIEGQKSSYTFRTPSCWQFHKNDMQICPPFPPSNITSTHELIRKDYYSINVTWNMAKFSPNFYIVKLNPYSRDETVSQNVSGNKNFAYFPEVHKCDINYDILVAAVNKNGITENWRDNISLKEIYTSFWERYKKNLIVMAVLISFVMILMVLLTFAAIQNRRNKRKYKNEMYSKEIELREMARSHNKHNMEIDLKNLDLCEELGEGAFGIVRKGILKPFNQYVAVKTLKDQAGIDDKDSFLREIGLMKSVGQHKNIVGIVGHSTINFDKMMLLTEYCSEGNLLNYLKKFRDRCSTEITVEFPSMNKSPEHFFNLNTSIDGKFSANDKSFSAIFETENVEIKYPACEMQNTIINKLYDHHYYDNNDISNRNKNLNICTKLDIKDKSPDKFTPKHVFQRDEKLLTSHDLLQFAKQIATGMEFLASKKIVHRDLAARNVLVCGDKTVKIADFGLSRDIYEENIYKKTSRGRLPIKWLALESMTEKQEYTSQSDVWSYGILLYEIVTMGCTPYPTVPVDCLLDYLKSGKRLSKPSNCSQKFYNLMYHCWHYEPEKRPSFTDILQTIQMFLLELGSNELIQIGVIDKTQCFEEPKDAEQSLNTSYLKPIEAHTS